MDPKMRGGFVLVGMFCLAVVAGQAEAQPASSAGDAGKYSGTSGSQVLQEQMYEARMKEILGESQASPQPAGMGGQQGIKGSEESSQKMQGQSGMKGSSPGDRTMEEGKTKGKK